MAWAHFGGGGTGSRPDSGGALVGAMHGEGGVGLELATGVPYLEQRLEWNATIGLTFRIPATLAAWLILAAPSHAR